VNNIFTPPPIIALSAGDKYKVVFKKPHGDNDFSGVYQGEDSGGRVIMTDPNGKKHHINPDEILELIED